MTGKAALRTTLVAVAGFLVAGCTAHLPATPQALQAPGDAQAAPAPRSGAYHAVLFYIPNRLADVLDIVSFGIGLPWPPHIFPASAHANVHLTRAFQVGVGHTHGLFIGKDYQRRLTWVFNHNEFSLGPLTVAGLTYRHWGESGETSASIERAGMLLPGDEPFAQGMMDYWAIGVNAGLLVAAVKVDVHVRELFDALLGFIFLDPMGDDI